MEKETSFKEMLEYRKQLHKEWAESGLLEGLSGMKKTNIAYMFESPVSAMPDDKIYEIDEDRIMF